MHHRPVPPLHDPGGAGPPFLTLARGGVMTEMTTEAAGVPAPWPRGAAPLRLARSLAVALAVAASGAAALAQGPASNDTRPEASPEGLTFLGRPVTADDIAAGRAIYAERCASCHGAALEGQPNWQRRLANGRMPAPPHDRTGHTWHHSDRNLFIVTRGGPGAIVPGYESDMPAFGEILTEDEIADVLSFIKSTWPARQRAFQAEVSANDKGSL